MVFLGMTHQPYPEPLRRMPDGTVKQVDPLSGTRVWTVPGRGNRPVGADEASAAPVDSAEAGRYCAFCESRYLETPPEKSRITRAGDGWQAHRGLTASEVLAEPAEFRRIPNLFEIVTYDYWTTNYGYQPADTAREHATRYLAEAVGRKHVNDLLQVRRRASGEAVDGAEAPREQLLDQALAFFAGCHDVIVARRHHVPGALHDDDLASSGTLTPDEHEQYVAITVDALRDLYRTNRYARYVAVFQNWRKPAGASFDHLHKQLVAVDEHSERTDTELSLLRGNGNLYNEWAVDYAARHDLLVAENEHAVAFAGFGHRFPSFDVYSKGPCGMPWEQDRPEVRGMSDVVHALHAATGPGVPCNEEWHHQPPDVDLTMPWRVMLKWRVSTLAGFEGGTKIYLNTIDPWALRDRVVPRLERLRGQGLIATDLAVGTECPGRPNSLRYNPALR